ncbi:mono/diheme cytochrome c family protein [Cupriavidus metallidurans]|jgi:mono/diheme cytochrome c family protein|uniref:Cytochrome c, class I:Cytochrome d1, heme region n=1 Tax=Cupriavidus metallidurans (strain ATCC 43123 / DSM 2839 / NBRC 102507 / CH34) TaxID=266264 RepID=Q1LI23_CUPMC|nr:nitrite reductase [Cupriavidus metallidurans]ABF10203.1 Cytochrome c, class I:Cytochrome d1, heme region precursor [Cupriavidus metallidurans CH34]KWW39999.1 Nitrite reductase [Cupriavidus metallidurans]MDE4919681.1 cytochrome D1 domain-containing protein [Cupriavidus metallidurans]QGS29007.1 cytochrome C [Cupriavidus metallidurans]
MFGRTMLFVTLTGVSSAISAMTAEEIKRADALYQANCAVCHSASRGGYVGPALHKDRLVQSEAALRGTIMTGIPDTLMPPFHSRLPDADIHLLAEYIHSQPVSKPEWSMKQAQDSLEVLIDEKTLPSKPTYKIDSVYDLMVVMARGRYGRGMGSDNAKTVFLDGKTNQVVGEIATPIAPHIMDFSPVNERWAWLKSDDGYVYKIDLYSLKVVRKIKTGLTGPGIAVSNDGKWLAASSFVPNLVMILKADTLEPVKHLRLEGTDPDGKFIQSAGGPVIGSRINNKFALTLRQAGQIWIVDPDREGMPVTKLEKVGRKLHDTFLTPDGRYSMVASYDDNKIVAIDLKEDKVVRDIPAGCQPHVGSGAVTPIGGRMLAFGTNIGKCDKGDVVTVWDTKDFSVVKNIRVAGPTESPAAHPDAPYVAVDIVSKDKRASQIQLIDKQKLEVVRTLEAGGHAFFPEYTRDGKYLYVSAGYYGDRIRIYDSKTLELVAEHKMESPAGIFSRARTQWITVGLPPTRKN